MWNPFSRKPTHAGEPRSPEIEAGSAQNSREQYEIASIEYMGTTCVITFVATELTRDHGVEELASMFHELSSAGHRRLVLDIQNVQQMDSASLGVLVDALNAVAASGGRIAVTNANRNVAYLFKLTRLDRVFPICPDVLAGIAAVERGTGAMGPGGWG